MTESKIDGKMTDSKIKRILGAELKVGDVVVLTDDDGMDRYFTIREPLEAVDAIAQTRCVTFGGSTRAFGRKWYKHSGDYVYIVASPPSDKEKLAVLVQGLQKEAFNPVARQLLESIGEDSAQSAQFAPWCEPPGF